MQLNLEKYENVFKDNGINTIEKILTGKKNLN